MVLCMILMIIQDLIWLILLTYCKKLTLSLHNSYFFIIDIIRIVLSKSNLPGISIGSCSRFLCRFVLIFEFSTRRRYLEIAITMRSFVLNIKLTHLNRLYTGPKIDTFDLILPLTIRRIYPLLEFWFHLMFWFYDNNYTE